MIWSIAYPSECWTKTRTAQRRGSQHNAWMESKIVPGMPNRRIRKYSRRLFSKRAPPPLHPHSAIKTHTPALLSPRIEDPLDGNEHVYTSRDKNIRGSFLNQRNLLPLQISVYSTLRNITDKLHSQQIRAERGQQRSRPEIPITSTSHSSINHGFIFTAPGEDISAWSNSVFWARILILPSPCAHMFAEENVESRRARRLCQCTSHGFSDADATCVGMKRLSWLPLDATLDTCTKDNRPLLQKYNKTYFSWSYLTFSCIRKRINPPRGILAS
jgi:hypothetical protein